MDLRIRGPNGVICRPLRERSTPGFEKEAQVLHSAVAEPRIADRPAGLTSTSAKPARDAPPKRPRQFLRAHAHLELAVTLIIVAVIIRATLASAGWPPLDSDDATMGLMATHILTRGEHPLFFYGQGYMGSMEAYTGALMFALMGISAFALKCGLILLYACFMLVMYWLLAQLFSRAWALPGLLMLALGTSDMLYHELRAYGGYVETLLFGALMTAIATWLVRTYGDPQLRRRRLYGYAGWGLAAGLGVWSDPLVAPFVALSALALAVTCWQDVRGIIGRFAIAGLVIGISPWIFYLATAASPRLESASYVHAQTALLPSGGELLHRVLGTLLISLPNKTGAQPMCQLAPNAVWPPQQWASLGVQGCVATRGAWSIGFIVLLLGAVALELNAWRAWRRDHRGGKSRGDRAALSRGAGRLIALAAPGVTIMVYAVSPQAASAPASYSRYLITTLIALPVLGATLWERASAGARRSFGWGRAARLGAAGITGLLVLMLALGTVGAYRGLGAEQQTNQARADLVQQLIRENATRIYAPFDSCYWIMFQSNDRVMCSIVTGDQLVHIPSRYPPYDAAVESAPDAAYVFPLATPGYSETFPRWAAQHGWQADATTVDGQYIIFRVRPASR